MVYTPGEGPRLPSAQLRRILTDERPGQVRQIYGAGQESPEPRPGGGATLPTQLHRHGASPTGARARGRRRGGKSTEKPRRKPGKGSYARLHYAWPWRTDSPRRERPIASAPRN